MRTVIDRTARLLGGLALLAGILLALSAPARAQTITATPQNVIVAKDAAQGATTITWDAGAGVKNLGATLWQEIDGGKETLVAGKAKGSQSILIGAGETRVFRLHNFINTKVLASVTVTASKQGAAPDENAPNAGVAPAANGAPANADAANQRDDDSPVSFTGTWPTISGGTHQYTVILKQVGNTVTGTFSPGNCKILDGVVKGRKLTFNWTQDGGYEGTAEFVMNEDGKGFTGTSNAIKPTEFTVPWSTYTPPVTSFAGTWETIINGTNSIALTMAQTGDQVTGVYPGNGKIAGTVSGRVLRFKWESDDGIGSGRFVMEEKDHAFSGTYNTGDNPDDVDATWNGKLPAGPEGSTLPGEEPVPIPNKKEEGTPGPNDKPSGADLEKKMADYEASKEDKPSTFGGTWQGKWGKADLILILQQDGNRVTGQLRLTGGDLGFIRDGDIVGNTLRFHVWRVVSPHGLMPWERDDVKGSGELVMDDGGESFTGTVLGAATSGSLIAR